MLELRLYYECLEQALHFLKPAVESGISGKNLHAHVRLVKRARRAAEVPVDSCLYPVLSLVTPDALLTAITGDTETPLVLFEFSEAVTTEDHELQRSYGACAAMFAEMFYVKISGRKESDHTFGGARYEPFSTPRIFAETLGWRGYIYAEWDTEGTQALKNSGIYLSCPPRMPLIENVVGAAIKSIAEKESGWFTRALTTLENSKSYREHQYKTGEAGGAQNLLMEWRKRQERNSNRARLRFFVNKESVAAKINRFTHSMDPDRGILVFTSLVFSLPTRRVFGVYALERQRTPGLKESIGDIATLRRRAQTALMEIDRGGLPDWLATAICHAAKSAADMNEVINFDDVWAANEKYIRNHRVASALAFFMDGLRLNHNGPLLQWDRRKLLRCTDSENICDGLRRVLGFHNRRRTATLQSAADDIDEDEITYALVHRVLRPSGFQIVAVSYPGAQGGTPILPKPTLGKSQPREYLDVIALFPGKEVRAALNESKGMFSKAAVEADCRKLLAYKENPQKQAALARTLARVGHEGALRSIVVGVSFGGNALTHWRPDDIDFMFILPQRSRWKIGLFSNELIEVIREFEGETGLPLVYKIAPS